MNQSELERFNGYWNSKKKKVDNSRLVHGMAVTKEIDYDVFTNAMDKQALDCGYRA